MENSELLKNLVKEKYSEIANQTKLQNETSCCGVGGCSTVDYAVFADDYSKLKGYNSDADLGLGCGLPTEFAQIKAGDVVVDLGSGAGNDCFVAREIAGESGKIIGIDMTDAMIEKARENADKLGFNNVEFRHGDIEQIPMGANKADVVVSNCVLNLVPDKNKAFKEIYRILKPGGHFSISDVVIKGELPEKLKNDAEMYAGCVSGAIQMENYLQIITDTGFDQVSVQKEKAIQLPDEILSEYLTPEEISEYRNGSVGIYSITVYGSKPATCCEPGCC
ncbi:MAG: arsenite methyltransferase [Saprospiraceae bacterium]|nr:arsenite methyltransferase [Saprospiraceae bacterium]